jgi:hypothetical protein
MKCLISNVLLSIVTVAAVGLAKPVFASSGATTSSIENTFASSSTYFPQGPAGDFMVTLAGIISCAGRPGYFYTLKTDTYYSDFIAQLMFARANHRNAKISWTTDVAGWCHITSIVTY